MSDRELVRERVERALAHLTDAEIIADPLASAAYAWLHSDVLGELELRAGMGEPRVQLPCPWLDRHA